MTNHRPICLVAAVFNISLYFYIFFNELPKNASSIDRNLTVNPTNPLDISVPQSISQSKIKIQIWRDFCPRPIVRVRLVGPEIHVFPPFTLDPDNSSPNVHTLEVDIQKLSLLVGVYKVEANIIRCHDEGKKAVATITNDTTFSCRAESNWDNILNIGSYDSNGSNWIWVHSPQCKSQLNGGHRSPECAEPGSHPNQVDYVFMEMNRETKSLSYDNLVTLKDGITTLSKPTSLLSTSDESSSLLNYFSELTNYELVCWLGDDDAQRYFRAFMDLYPLMGSRGQRPFKFKYIRLTDTSDPLIFSPKKLTCFLINAKFSSSAMGLIDSTKGFLQSHTVKKLGPFWTTWKNPTQIITTLRGFCHRGRVHRFLIRRPVA